MSLIFIDGFDHYSTSDITKKWSSTAGAISINSTAGRRGSGCLACNAGGTATATKSIPAGAAWVMGWAISVPVFPVSPSALVALLDSGSSQCDIRLNPDGSLSVARGGVVLASGTSTFVLATNTYYFVEWKVTISDAIGAASCKVRVNGIDVITVATGQDTKTTANAFANQVRLGPTANVIGGIQLFDDFYICDQSGGANADFLGDIRIDTLYPNGDGSYGQFAPSAGTSHYSLVDEPSPNTTDYNDGINIGDRDSYGFSNLAALSSQVIYGVQENIAIQKDDAGTKSAAAFARSSTINADGASVPLSTSQTYICQIFEADPATGGDWTEGAVNAAEFGVKVTA